MTSINGFLPARLLTAQQSLPGLAVGESIKVEVLGPTRNGLAVLIGQRPFQLDVPSKLSGTQTLTLQGVSSSSSELKAQVIALDNRPLSSPIPVTLAVRSQATSPAGSAIVQKSQLQVVAHPVDAKGKTLGPGLSLQLQAQRPAVTIEGQTGSAPAPTAAPRPDGSHAAVRQGTEAGQRTQPSSAASVLSEPGASPGRGAGLEPIGPVVSKNPALKENGSPLSPSPASVRPAEVRSAVTNSAIGEVRGKGVPAPLHRSGATSVPSYDGETMPAKSVVASAVSTYRSGMAVGPAAPSPDTATPSPSVQLPAASEPVRLESSQTMKTIVVARTDVGQVILKAADQLLRVEQPIDLPIGTTLQATLAAGASASPMQFSSNVSDDQSSSLTKLIALLDSIDQAGRQSDFLDKGDLGKQLPTPDRHLASRLLNLLAAGSDWKVQSGQRPSPDQHAASPIHRDQIQAMVRDLGESASEPLTDGWKSLTLPIGHDQTQAVCCYFRNHELDPDEKGPDGEDRRDDAERAVFDVSLSRLGRCQIDALCQEQRFDLLIRTEKQLSNSDERDIASLFHSACEVAGMNGEIGFKTGVFFEPVRMPATARNFRI